MDFIVPEIKNASGATVRSKGSPDQIIKTFLRPM